MIFGLKRKRSQDGFTESDAEALAIVGEDAGSAEREVDDLPPLDIDDVDEVLEEAMDDVGRDEDPGVEELVDHRAEGPFDIEEVDLTADDIVRIDLGPLVITPWDGLGLQLQVNEASRRVQAVTGVWKGSGLEVALFAAPASGGLADELREDLVEEAEQAGGTATLADGPFGSEVRRVLPQEGPAGEQLFHVSRIWFAEGPRWLLRATLLGEAALGAPDDPRVGPFVEFFRNLVVRRGDKPMVPGELIPMNLPAGSEG